MLANENFTNFPEAKSWHSKEKFNFDLKNHRCRSQANGKRKKHRDKENVNHIFPFKLFIKGLKSGSLIVER